MSESLYVHFPYCVHLCNYCDFYKRKLTEGSDIGGFESRLQKDWSQLLKLAHSYGKVIGPKLNSIYLGGGTPSLWDSKGAEFFQQFLEINSLSLDPGAEFTLEADPGAWTENGILRWEETGVNRYSVGVQAFDEDFLKIMDRHHDKGEAQKTLKYFKEKGLNFSADLMLGLPYSVEKKRDIIEELKNILQYGPAHLSVYILKTRGNYPHKTALPEDDYIRDEYMKVSEFLESKGFSHYEVSNFARPGNESKHNFKYWQAMDVHAIGPNATGFMKSRNGAIRYQHKVSGGPPTIENLDREALLLEEVYLGLRTNRGLDLQALLELRDDKSRTLLEVLIQNWSRSGYLKSSDVNGLILSSSGFLMIDSIMDDLFKNKLL